MREKLLEYSKLMHCYLMYLNCYKRQSFHNVLYTEAISLHMCVSFDTHNQNKLPRWSIKDMSNFLVEYFCDRAPKGNQSIIIRLKVSGRECIGFLSYYLPTKNIQETCLLHKVFAWVFVFTALYYIIFRVLVLLKYFYK